MKKDIYKEVTEQIVRALEAGVAPWVKPWKGGSWLPRNGSTGRAYNGVNVLLLWIRSIDDGFTSPEWFTYRQAKAMGGQVRKGEKGQMVVFWRVITVGEGKDEREIPVPRHYTVFNRSQIDGLPEVVPQAAADADAFPQAQALIDAAGADLVHADGRACYSPSADRVTLPPFDAFDDAGAYYATAFHELVHWTGHPSRLDRDLSGRFGSESYAAEELVAELGSAFLCAELGIQGRLQHAEYIGNWIQVLQNDHRAIFTAASHAKKAASLLNRMSDTQNTKAA